MASREFRKKVAKLKKKEIQDAVLALVEEESRALTPKEYVGVYGTEFKRRASDSLPVYVTITKNRNREIVNKMKKKELENLYVAYLEIRKNRFKGPASDADPEIWLPGQER